MLAGDATGYVWGQRNERTEIPIENSRDRQTYYGGLNLYNQEFFIKPYPTGNGLNTIAFLKDLQAAYPKKKLIILWDNASYQWFGQFLVSALRTENTSVHGTS